MNLWIDDIRPAPKDWVWCKTVWEAKKTILDNFIHIKVISLDHDAGDFCNQGGDYIEILNWLERLSKSFSENFPIKIRFHLHTMNPVGRERMENIIRYNQWEEIK